LSRRGAQSAAAGGSDFTGFVTLYKFLELKNGKRQI
jgi:hypothetical protein